MPQYFQNPLNGLKHAQGLLAVGSKQPALELLIELLKSKKHRSYTRDHDQIINVYLDITIDLKKMQQAKEGLYQFKNISQTVSPKSLENVILRFLEKSESRTEEAKLQSQKLAEARIDDLDNMDHMNFSMLMGAVTGEKTQDRTDRQVLTPWLKFMWDCYRQVLDLLRNNSRVEKLYHTVARKAFMFCYKYDRRTEFRKICDNLRNHIKLSDNKKHQHSVQLDNPDTQHLHLDTKVQQLDFAIKIELWQEAFKAIEDIHTLMCMSKRPPKPNLLNDFYSKMCKVFVKSESMLFHACTIFKLFKLHKEQKRNPTREDLTKKASKLLVATLSVPITKQKHGVGKILDMEGAIINKVVHLSKLLGLEKAPTREALLDDFMRYNLIEYVPRQLKELYEWLELKNHPLKMADRVSSVFEWMSEQTAEPELVNYIPHLRQVVIARVLQQVSSLYNVISFERLMKFLPAEYCSRFELEQFIVDASRNGQLQVRIDHMNDCVYLGTDLLASSLFVEDEFFGPNRLQALPSERVSASINKMAKSMVESYHMLNKEAMQNISEKKMNLLESLYNRTKAKIHSSNLKRWQIIEERKERMESEKRTKDEEERLAVQKQEEATKAAEQARINKERKEREERMRKEQEKAADLQKKKEGIEMLKKSGIGKLFENVKVDDFMKKDFDTEEMVNKQIALKEKKKKEMNDKRKNQERKRDHEERALRQEEIPLLTKYVDDKKVNDELLWNESEKERVEKSLQEYKRCVATRERLLRIKQDVNDHMQPLREAKKQERQAKMAAWLEEMESMKAQQLAQRKYQRKLERFAKRLLEKQEEAEERRQEQIRLEREQEEQRRREEEQMRQEKMQEERRKRDEQAQKQRQRELEIEQKNSSAPWRPSRKPSVQKSEPASTPWRRKPAAQQESSGDKWRSTRSNEDSRPPSQSGDKWRSQRSNASNEVSRPSGGRFTNLNSESSRRNGSFASGGSGRFQDESSRGNRDGSFRSRGFGENATRTDSSGWSRGTAVGRERRENPQGRSDSPSMRRGEPAGQGAWRSQTVANRGRGEGPTKKQDDGWTQVTNKR